MRSTRVFDDRVRYWVLRLRSMSQRPPAIG